ncbi:MAG: DUF4446 family protein [bacterium]|nr:DUF4446 family protein [bacterium]
MLLNQQLTLVVLGVIFTWLAVISFYFYKLAAHYHKLTYGISRGNLSTILEKTLKEQDVLTKRVEGLLKRVEKSEEEGLAHLQKMELVRFNPFSETGGDQSFTLAILNGLRSGVVISSLHSRNTTRIYAKPVKKGKVDGYQLSKEEAEALTKTSKN